MELSTCEYLIKDIQSFSAVDFNANSTYLWVWHADKIPPHIGLSANGEYYSLKASGKDEGLEISAILQLIERKGIVTLAFELTSDVSLTDVVNTFNKESKATSNGRTCLGPVKEILNIESARKIHDLLDSLYAQEEVKQVIGFNVDDSFAGIPMYEIEEILDRLKKLENA